MNAFPTEKDGQQCLDLLINQYKVPDKIIKNMFSQTMSSIIAQDSRTYPRE